MGTVYLTMFVRALLLACLVGYASCCNAAFFQMLSSIFGGGGGGGGGGGESTTPKPTGDCMCGKANRAHKIVGGQITEVNEYPWQVGLSSGGATPYCGGSIISKKEILTAAHCTKGDSASSIYVLVGDHDITTSSDNKKYQVCSKKEHGSYSSSTLDNDFAILTLCDELEFDDKVMPVCLPSTEGQGTEYENKDAIVSGWGTLSSGGSRPQYLNDVTVQTMSNAKCCGNDYQYSCNELTDAMICASKPGKDSCQGDSGGPLVVADSSGYYTLVGVVSWGYGCADAVYPGVYARVTNALGWIKDGSSDTCTA